MTYDKLSRTITDSHGEQRVLSPKCGGFFELLMEAQGAIVTREQMRQSIWGHDVVSEDAINHLVCRLRKELKSLSEECPWTIEVIPKVGYRISVSAPLHDIKYWFNRCSTWFHEHFK